MALVAGTLCEGRLRYARKKFLNEAEDILKNFEEDISVSGIASINEIYDGDPPHCPEGAPFRRRGA